MNVAIKSSMVVLALGLVAGCGGGGGDNNGSGESASPSTSTPATTSVTDGATLYADFCAKCHGTLASSSKSGVTLARLQGAIAANTGNMGSLNTLTAAQQQAIVTALAPAATTPAPAPTPAPVTDGATLYANNCATCHGTLASSAKGGATATRIQTAINNNTGGMGSFSTLSSTQISAIATALAGVTPAQAPAAACGSCHAIPPATGRHAKHSGQNIACSTCHGSGYSSTTVNSATHQNGTVNLTTTINWNATNRSCSPACHGTRSW